MATQAGQAKVCPLAYKNGEMRSGGKGYEKEKEQILQVDCDYADGGSSGRAM